MNIIKQLYEDLISKITAYEKPEAQEIVFLFLESRFNISKNDLIFTDKNIAINEVDKLEFSKKVNNNEPIQYILGETWFRDLKFSVSEAVLIPRPETEEIIDIAIKLKPNNFLDLGTGSGCIAISLNKELTNSKGFAIDISNEALKIAKQNNQNIGTNISFHIADILKFKNPFKIGKFELIISNPPYVKKNEIPEIRKNVLAFEPDIALFVENDDPLIFYSKIAEIGLVSLEKGGHILVEINSYLGKETKELFDLAGYKNTQIIKDFFGRDRFVIAQYI